jgi:hypothetical protein
VVLKKIGIFLTISLALCTMWANHMIVCAWTLLSNFILFLVSNLRIWYRKNSLISQIGVL